MVDAAVGRLLVASLHQGITEVTPSRLEFYESWLRPTGLRDGRIGLAPLGAVLSFVQREEPPADHGIPDVAGTCAAAWAHGATSDFRKRLRRRLPSRWRIRTALKSAQALVIETVSGSKVSLRLRDGQGTVDIQSPLFDYLRGPSAAPMRRYYAAAYTEILRLCEVDAVVSVDESAAGCRLTIAVQEERASPDTLRGAA